MAHGVSGNANQMQIAKDCQSAAQANVAPHCVPERGRGGRVGRWVKLFTFGATQQRATFIFMPTHFYVDHGQEEKSMRVVQFDEAQPNELQKCNEQEGGVEWAVGVGVAAAGRGTCRNGVFESKNAIKFVYKMPLNDSWHIFTNGGSDKMTAPHG